MGPNRRRKSSWKGILHCIGWPPTKVLKWTREVNASKCLKRMPTAKSGEAVTQAVGGCEERSGNYCMVVKEKQAQSRSPLLLEASGLILNSRRWSGLCLVGC